MSRLTNTERTAALPHLATWTAANIDVNSTTAGTAPVTIPKGVMANADMLVVSVASDGTGDTPIWQLLLVDRSINDLDGDEGTVIAALSAVSSDVAGTRLSTSDGAGLGYSLHNPLQFDVRGLGQDSPNCEWVLALEDVGGATHLYLMHYEVIKKRPL